MEESNSTESNFVNGSFASDNRTEVSTIKPEYYADHDLSYLLLPLSSLLIIAFLTVTVIILLKRKRRIDRLRHHLMPYYNFAPGEEDDWETELLESEGEISSRRDYNTVSLSKALPPQQK
ncbi:small integral membrane protein 29 [Halyomorpha halys]|uniref:small integral membrane protein 29 n=1 Tax=Halyomorpha halys TaxID=286706 RepID=UPI0006D4EB90|nr:uncharacterized protein C3orf18 homolog [Halyomorpha halys]XP_014294126.1 uncharacterized protein C3orf18 homolog [Halyomorpha halys]